MILIDMLKSFDEANNRFWKFVGDALGITPDEPPIVSDHPPIHSVDGQMHLGEAITKGNTMTKPKTLREQVVITGEQQRKKLDIIIEQLRIIRLSSEKDFEENAIGSALIILGTIYAIDHPLDLGGTK